MAQRILQVQVAIDWQLYEDFIKYLEDLETTQGAPFAIVSFDKCACCNNVYFFILQMGGGFLILIRPVYSRQEAVILLEYFHDRLFKDGNEAVEAYFKYKEKYGDFKNFNLPYVYTFDTSRNDLDKQIKDATDIIKNLVK